MMERQLQPDTVGECLAAARSGDEQAFAGLIAKQMPAIRSIAARFRCPGLDFEDAVQEGLIGLFRAIETFDAQKAASFFTYAGTCVQNEIISAARAAGRKKHAPLNTSVPFADDQSAPGPEEILVAAERYQSTMRSIHTRLSPLEKRVLSLFLEEKPYQMIAKQLSVSEKAVDNALQRVRGKLK